MYVTDVVRHSFGPRSLNFLAASGTWGSSPQSVNRLVELLNGPLVNLPKRPGEPDVTWADTTAIRRDLEWVPQISFEEGVGRVLANIDYWAEAPLWDEASIASATASWFEMLNIFSDDRP